MPENTEKERTCLTEERTMPTEATNTHQALSFPNHAQKTLICSQHGKFGWWYARKEGTPTRRRSQPLPMLQPSLRRERRQLSAFSRRLPVYVAVAAV